MKSDASLLIFGPVNALPFGRCTSLPTSLASPTRLTITALALSFCVTASSINRKWCRNLYLLSIAYDLSPRLRSRLTLGG